MGQNFSPLANSQPATGGPSDTVIVFHSLLILFPVLLAGYVIIHVESEFNNILFKAIADACIQVSTFVAGTFFIFFGIERVLNNDAAALLRKATFWQVPAADALGALPSCGGAIIVVTQYVTGRFSFRSVVAVLTATMGGAAFLLIAQQPLFGLAMVALGFFVGTLSDWIVNFIHGRNFLRGSLRNGQDVDNMNKVASTPWPDWIWLIIMLPERVLNALVAYQVDVDALYLQTIISTSHQAFLADLAAYWPSPYG